MNSPVPAAALEAAAFAAAKPGWWLGILSDTVTTVSLFVLSTSPLSIWSIGVMKEFTKMENAMFRNSDVDQMIISGLSTPQMSRNRQVIDIA